MKHAWKNIGTVMITQIHGKMYWILHYMITCNMSVVFSGNSGLPNQQNDHHNKTELLLKVELNFIILTLCDKAGQWTSTCRWLSVGTSASQHHQQNRPPQYNWITAKKRSGPGPAASKMAAPMEIKDNILLMTK